MFVISQIKKVGYITSHLTRLKETYLILQNWHRMVTSKKFVLVKHFDGAPKVTDLKLIEEELPSIKDGGK